MSSAHVRRNSDSVGTMVLATADHTAFKSAAQLLMDLAIAAAGELVTLPLFDHLAPKPPVASVMATVATSPKLPEAPKGSKYWKHSLKHHCNIAREAHAHAMRIDDAHVSYTYCEIFTIPEETDTTDGDGTFECRVATKVCNEPLDSQGHKSRSNRFW